MNDVLNFPGVLKGIENQHLADSGQKQPPKRTPDFTGPQFSLAVTIQQCNCHPESKYKRSLVLPRHHPTPTAHDSDLPR